MVRVSFTPGRAVLGLVLGTLERKNAMTPKPRIWRLKPRGIWTVCYIPNGGLVPRFQNFRTWDRALAFALAVAEDYAQEPPC